jgi:hypothetical protein
MRWRVIPAEPESQSDDDSSIAQSTRLEIDEMIGELGLTYLNDVAVWCASQNIRSGYQIRIEGHCFKGPYAIAWDQIRIVFEDEVPAGLTDHLTELWGPQNVALEEKDSPRLERLA